jgi:hypothetical protein
MKDIRFDCISGKIEDIGASQACVEFNEWHNRGGLDLNFYSDDEVKTVSLTRDELHCLALVISATKYVDVPSLADEAEQIIKNSEKRREERKLKEQIALSPSPLTGLVDYSRLDLLDEQ